MNPDNNQAPTFDVGGAEFDSEVLKSRRPVLVLFWAPWSRPCQILKPVLNEVAAECAGRVTAIKVNVDDNPDLGVWYGIQSIPTLLYFVQGTVRARIVGTASKEAILSKLQPITANP